ncbi:MAG: NAD(P)-dependent oxidoreductase [Bacteroidota bacterium]|nr:NAD(P)-dependent oxidoreductase [Bacteroidota bacterium]
MQKYRKFAKFTILIELIIITMEVVKIGVLRETKVPPDHRVALPPQRVLELKSLLPNVEILVQPSSLRCYKDEEYTQLGITLQEDLSDCDMLIGVKEVDIPALIPDKTYLFFAHVAKEQPYNRKLLQAFLEKRIRMIDYEYLTDPTGIRLIAFGRWAGIVGAYNGLRGLGVKSGNFQLKPAHECHDRQEMDAQLDKVVLNNARILVSGGGRVAQGAMETLQKLGIREVSPESYSSDVFSEPVFCRIDPWHYVERNDNLDFDLQHFFKNPNDYHSIALQYLHKTDLYIAAHYWDPDSPRFFELNDLAPNNSGLNVMGTKFYAPNVIADISCDINGSVPTTTHATTIADPFYYYDNILMMTVDNLPGELPRDASDEFSDVLVKEILPRLILNDPEKVIERASITANGELTKIFSYLENYSKGL